MLGYIISLAASNELEEESDHLSKGVNLKADLSSLCMVCLCVHMCIMLCKHMPLFFGTHGCPTTEAQAEPHPPKLKLTQARGGPVQLGCGPSIPLASLSPCLLWAAAGSVEERRGV